MRLVKGAYWDTEVKRAQERGLDGYPVFTRKAMTDLNYVACADRLLAARPRLYPQFATHNALTVATILERAGGTEGYEFQRLHGMGDALYERLMEERPGLACRTYAPVGGHRDLLAYLVRRLLENGANSSFVSVAADPAVPVEALLKRPADLVGGPDAAASRHIPLPRDLYGPGRRNSAGVELGHAPALEALLSDIADARAPAPAAGPLVDGVVRQGVARPVLAPATGVLVGTVAEADAAVADAAIAAARRGFRAWERTPVAARADALLRAANLLEARRGRLIGSCRPRPERRWTIASPSSARPWTSCATTRHRRATSSARARSCRALRARTTASCIAAAGSSFASARGTSRSPFSSARSAPLSQPVTPWWRSPPSRRPSSPSRPSGSCTRPAFPPPPSISSPATARLAHGSSAMR